MKWGIVYSSGNHKIYGYKVELNVRYNGLEIFYIQHYDESVLGITIMTRSIEDHRLWLEMGDEDKEIDDVYFMSEEYPNHWAFMADKGYQRAKDMIRCVIRWKKPARRVLRVNQEKFNRDLFSDRIAVENYFGRMGLWKVISQKWEWSETLYDTFVCMCIALTNIQAHRKPLGSVESDWYNRYMNRPLHIGDSRKPKRAETQEIYRERRKQLLRVG